jgi:hypothetical protein
MTQMVSVVETPLFLARAERLMSDTEREALVTQVAADPTAGDLVRGTGGLRKMRIPLQGRGKRGGGRLIYWFHSTRLPVVMLLAFAKNEKEDLSSDDYKRLVKAIEGLSEDFGG